MALEKNMEAPQYVDKILSGAVAEKASDIYWLPEKDSYCIRYRVNGIQKLVDNVPNEFGVQCVARIKVMSGLLTYRTTISQDGVIRDVKGLPGAELRVAVMPTSHGERATIRVQAMKNELKHLDELNYPEAAVESLKGMLLNHSGMIVLTGPTGCGKTTTIYAMIRELLKDHQDPASIITIEDPVECEIDGISQVSVTRSSDEWGNAEALRASLRQDVKTIVIGEMRDKEVVRVALDAALTGHRVITSYHAGDIPSVYARMLHQGFEPFLIASAITGVVSQRLVSGVDGTGRVPVIACLSPTDEWRDFVTEKPGLSDLKKKIREYENADLKTVALDMAEKGLIEKKDAFLI